MADLIQEGKITHWGISEANERLPAEDSCRVPGDGGTEPILYDGNGIMNRYSPFGRIGRGPGGFSPMANGFPHRSNMTKGSALMLPPTTVLLCPSSLTKLWTKNAALLKLLADMAAEKEQPRPRSPWPGCCVSTRGLYPSLALRKEDRIKKKCWGRICFLTPQWGARSGRRTGSYGYVCGIRWNAFKINGRSMLMNETLL